MLGVDHVDVRDGGTMVEEVAGKVAPATAEIGDPAGNVIGQMLGEQGGSVVDAIPAEDPGLAQPRAGAHRLQAGQAAPVVRRRALAPVEPEDPAVELRDVVDEAERLADILFETGGAVVVGAGADQSAAGIQQRPAARDVGEVLLLVLGQQHEAELVGAAVEARNDRPSGLFETQEVGPKRLFGIDVPERKRFRPQEERSLWGERSRVEGVGEGARRLCHREIFTGRERRVP